MDVSPKTLREVEFREKMRGYHPEDVDQFLERVAAGIEVLQDRLRQAIERAQRAEQAATEAGGNDDALRRTLLLAQRTADLAVQEAREQAARIVSGAEQQAQSLVGDAERQVHAMVSEAERRSQGVLSESEQRAQKMLSEAEQQARRGHEDTLVAVRAELAKLEVTRQRLQLDVETLTRWVDEHRQQLRAALEEALAGVEQIDMTGAPAMGAPYPLEGAATASAVPAQAVPAQAVPAQAVPAETSTPAGGDSNVSTWAPNPPSQAPGAAPAGSTWVGEDTVAWQRPAEELATGDSAGDADPYFAELRRAISDHDPLGPRVEGDPQTTQRTQGTRGDEG